MHNIREYSIIVENFEKLKIEVADITELLKKKEEQYLKEKQITQG